jgi:hypothetical protein
MYTSQVLKIADAARGIAQRLTGWRFFSPDNKKIWPIVSAPHSDQPVGDQSYTTAWLDLMHEAIVHFEISIKNQPKAETLRLWFESRMAGSTRVSRNLAKAMATFVRPPELMVGGLKPFVRREPPLSPEVKSVKVTLSGPTEVPVGQAASEITR